MQRLELATKRAERGPAHNERPVLITGGAGFIGANLAHRLLTQGREVLIYDNLSRPGVEANARALEEEFNSRVKLVVADTRDAARVAEAVSSASAVYHLAAQVAVTTSLKDPITDFAVNVQGTLNVLEALRRLPSPPPLLYTSTNKVYGSLSDIALGEEGQRVAPADPGVAAGISEARSLDFHSPYGCSKGAADQYVIDYARSFGIPAVVFRMSCIYGPRQCGNEDQGWVAHFLLQAMQGEPVTLYGDGRQVRDILFVDDLLDAMALAEQRIHELSGQAYNMGGGPDNAVSLLEVLHAIAGLTGKSPGLRFAEPRLGDQRYFVTDIGKFRAHTGFSPRTAWRDGLAALHRWFAEHRTFQSPGRTELRGGAQVAP